MKVSIIVRARNEERWISSCLKAVYNQQFKDFEVILIDNCSTDLTVEKAKKFDVNVMNVKEYLPGRALNIGFKQAKGEFLVCLSAHCIPKDEHWLENLLRNFKNDNVAGVYGRQEPMSQTSDLDKRDLWIVFGLDRRVQTKDSFFHNANSMIRRSVWIENKFDDNVTNIEDRMWGRKVIEKGYSIVYEPEASVYHYHGIHQSADPERCRNIVEIMESIEPITKNEAELIKKLNIVAIVPVKGEVEYLCGRPLIEYTLERAAESQFIDTVIVSTDNHQLAKLAKKFDAKVPFIRPPRLSAADVGIEQVLKYSLSEIEKSGNLPDLIVYLGIHAPFRPVNLIDTLVELLFLNNFDSVFAGRPTYKSCWRQSADDFQRVDEGFTPRQVKRPLFIGYPALGCVTYPWFIRDGKLLGNRIGIYETTDFLPTLEVTDTTQLALAKKIFRPWWNAQKVEKKAARSKK
jgi:rhamnosyltransferase